MMTVPTTSEHTHTPTHPTPIPEPRLHVVLYHPAIPQNTGNIARTCVGMNARLHLIHPMSFEITEHRVKRAGLDYWPHLRLTQHADEAAFLSWLGGRVPYLITKFGSLRFDEPSYVGDDVLIFGNENTGLPPAWHERWPGRGVYIPLPGPIRSYNVANTVAMVAAQAMLGALKPL